MILVLLYFMFLLLRLTCKVFGAYSEKEKVDTEKIGLTCFGLPIIAGVCTWILEGIRALTDSIVMSCILSVAECTLVVLVYSAGLFSLEKLIIGMEEKRKESVHHNGIRAEYIICGCIFLTGICGGVSAIPEKYLHRILQGINEYFGDWMIFISFWIITIVFMNHIVREKAYMNVLTKWKAQDGMFLIVMKVMIVLNSVLLKTLWFVNVAQPLGITPISVEYKWISRLGDMLFRIQSASFLCQAFIILPVLVVLYIIAAMNEANKDRKKAMTFGIKVIGECVVIGGFGYILWLGSWM